MLNVPIVNVPTQSFSIRLDDSFYDITIRLCAAPSRVEPFYINPIMAVDIVRDGNPIVTGQRAVSGYPLIPYRYLEDGNFAFITDNDELPDFNAFGVTQFLIFASTAELAEIRASV